MEINRYLTLSDCGYYKFQYFDNAICIQFTKQV